VLRSLLFSLLFFLGSTALYADNGRVVHLAWTENSDGSIQNADSPEHGLYFLEQRNQFLNYKDPNNPFFKIRYSWLGVEWTIVHLLALLLTILIQIFTFKKINRRMVESRFFKRWSYRFLKLFLWGAVIAGNTGVIWAIDFYNTEIHFRFHQLTDFKNATLARLDKGRNDRTYFLPKESTRIRFQLYRKNNNKWHTQSALPVLYFEQDESGVLVYKHDKRTFKVHPDSLRNKAKEQLIVIRQNLPNGYDTTVLFQVQNRQIVPYQLKKDRAQRILLFINGYRPVSAEQDPEKALQAINSKGLERPRSKNIIYNSDVFGYWPQEKFISVVKERFTPNRTLFADGHHSVNTSNHGSLLKFVSSAALYPKPCAGEHHCSTTKIAKQQEVRTYSLLATVPNYNGFRKRYDAGKQAGRNLLQELAKNGNDPKNDTLYTVSHSMGHAYFLGMASVLKGKIQFGSYYAFSPENPKGKTIKTNNWTSVFQYGTKLYGSQRHTPCQQDGVAPQWRMSGLAPGAHIGFPKALKVRLGYFSSHYIGYYTWVFDIPKGKPGYLGLD
jgi:hypothetical protein